MCVCPRMMFQIVHGVGLVRKKDVKIHVSTQRCSNMASDWLVAVQPIFENPGLRFFLN